MTPDQILDTQGAGQSDPSIYTSEFGVRLKLGKVPNLIVQDATRRLKEPTPPKVWIADKETEEENPNDPAYQKAQQEFEFERGMLAMSVYFVRGTRVLSIPEGFQTAESEEWSTELEEIAGLSIPNMGPRRYLAWLKYVALSDDDFHKLMTQIMRYSGTTLEVDVNRAADDFRNSPPRDSLAGADASEEGEHRDNVREFPGTSTGV